MRRRFTLIIGGAILAAASASALAHDDIGFGFSIAVPGASAYVGQGPVYAPPPVYVAPGTVYYEAPPATYYAPPTVYYDAPAPAYYGAPPGVTVYYGPSYDGFRERHVWRRDRDREDDDD